MPGAMFGPALTAGARGSLQVIQRLLDGKMPDLPRLAFSIVDVRDLAALHVRTMIEPAAVNQRFLATGELMWLSEIAAALRTQLGPRGARVPTRKLPDFIVRVMSALLPQLKALVPELGRRNEASSQKAHNLLGFTPRPAIETLIDTANYLLAAS